MVKQINPCLLPGSHLYTIAHVKSSLTVNWNLSILMSLMKITVRWGDSDSVGQGGEGEPTAQI